MKVVQGDLLALALEGQFDVIVHGCNCFCTMGAGIALSIATQFPEARAADRATRSGDCAKLGTLSSAVIHRESVSFAVVNAYTQYDWQGQGVLVDYGALEKAMRQVGQIYSGARIAYPRIGAGLAGGDWSQIAERIDRALEGQDHTYVERGPSILSMAGVGASHGSAG